MLFRTLGTVSLLALAVTGQAREMTLMDGHHQRAFAWQSEPRGGSRVPHNAFERPAGFGGKVAGLVAL